MGRSPCLFRTKISSSESLVKRKVGIAASIEGVEGTTVIGIERKCQLDALGQIGIRDEVTSERNKVGITLLYSCAEVWMTV
jgi:hypothetical protein